MNKRKRVKTAKKIKSIVQYILETIASLCTISGVSIVGANKLMSKELKTGDGQSNDILVSNGKIVIDFFIEHFWVIMSISFLIVLIFNGLIVPLYKIYKTEIPKEEAKPSLLVIWVYSCFFIFSLAGSLFSINHAKENPGYGVKVDIEDIPCEDDYSENYAIIEKEVINNYIIRACKELLPIEELKQLNGNELYYLRNGIYAYAGMCFESDYYKDFSWYNGIYSEEETIKCINSIQWKNINNIENIENEKNNQNRARE